MTADSIEAPAGKIARKPGLLALALWVVTTLLFLPALKHEFINYDDPSFVTENPLVSGGLTLAGIKRAFTEAPMANWQPLTWLSHMVDRSLFGLSPEGHHLGNVILHSTNAALLFLLLARITGAPWRSLAVAALFAVHPLRVESVAWVTARKDVLSGLFWMLSLLAYAAFAQCTGSSGRRRLWYSLSLLAFALGLMSKPVVITLPCVLLLLDGWPLNRLRNVPMGRLLLEKLPFLVLAAASAVITVLVQPKVIQDESQANLHLPVMARLAHALVSYVLYIGKFFAPMDLAVIYPHPIWHPVWQVCVSALLLAVVTLVVVRQRSTMPWLLMGWLWFLGVMLPMIGLVQIGKQSMADRFTYLPSIGLTTMLVWAVSDLAARKRWPLALPVAGAAAAVACCAWLSVLQLGYWQNSETLFRHTLAVTDNNEVAHLNLGTALTLGGRVAEAIPELQAALEIDPGSAHNQFNLGAAFLQTGHASEAVKNFEASVRLQPDSARFHFGLASALLAVGRIPEAAAAFAETVRLDPGHAGAHLKLGNIFFETQRLDEALVHFEACAKLRPDLADVQNNIGNVYFSQHKLDEAIPHYREALRLDPAHRFAAQHLNDLMKQKAGR